MGYTYETAAEALGMSRSGFAKLLAGDHPIDKRTALACAALAAGLEPYQQGRDKLAEELQAHLDAIGA